MRRTFVLAAITAPLTLGACKGNDLGSTSAPPGLDAGAREAASPDAAVTSCPAPTRSVSVAVFAAFTPADRATVTMTMPRGYALSGQLDVPAGVLANTGVDVVHSATGMRLYGAALGDGATYAFNLAAGRYDLGYWADIAVTDHVTARTRVSETVDVCGDRAHDVAFPSIPALSSAKITISNLTALDELITVSPLVLATADGAIELTTSDATWDATPAGANAATYDVRVPFGVPLRASVGGVPFGDVTITGDTTLAPPPLVTVTGTVSIVDPTLVGLTAASCGPFSAKVSDGEPRSFSLPLAKGTSCDLQVAARLPFGNLGSAGAPRSFDQDTSLTFAFPPVVDGLVRTTVAFTDEQGKPLPGGDVADVRSIALPSVPPGWTYDIGTQLDADGQLAGSFVPGSYAIVVNRTN